MAAAFSAEMMSPVSSIAMACLRATLRDSATMGVEQNRPMSTPGVAKPPGRGDGEIAAATSWQPAADATPCTAAITGWAG
jgi:hypothetical protein